MILTERKKIVKLFGFWTKYTKKPNGYRVKTFTTLTQLMSNQGL